MSRPIYVDLTFPKIVDFKFAYYMAPHVVTAAQ